VVHGRVISCFSFISMLSFLLCLEEGIAPSCFLLGSCLGAAFSGLEGLGLFLKGGDAGVGC